MILYNSFCGGLNLLLSRHAWWGSPISKGFPFGLFSLLMALLIRLAKLLFPKDLWQQRSGKIHQIFVKFQVLNCLKLEI